MQVFLVRVLWGAELTGEKRKIHSEKLHYCTHQILLCDEVKGLHWAGSVENMREMCAGFLWGR